MQSAAPTAAPASASARSPAARAPACTSPPTLQGRASVRSAMRPTQHTPGGAAGQGPGCMGGQHTCEHGEIWTAGLLPVPGLAARAHRLVERLRGPV